MKFLKGQKQFISYIYQRTYSWPLKECGQFPIAVLLAAFGRELFSSPRYLNNGNQGG